jgi:sec-independent protein translocase protein TatA
VLQSAAMPNIGPMEIILLAVVAALLFGPHKLPEMARSLGRHTREFKDAINGTGIDDALEGVSQVRSATNPTNLVKAAMPAPVKEMAAGVTEMKETVTDPLGLKKKERAEAEAEAAASLEEAAPAAETVEAAPLPAERDLPAPVPVSAAPETPAAP